MSHRYLIPGLVLAFGSMAAVAGEPGEVLGRAAQAARELSYQGVIVYQTQDRQETMRVVHRFQDGVEMERVQVLTGAPREILKRDDKVICVLSKDRRLSSDAPTPKGLFPTLTPQHLAQLAKVYAFEDVGTARIAGRNCRGVTISPRDEFRYGYEVWADEQTGVPLKVNLIGRDGTVLEQMQFTEIEFPAQIPDSALQTALGPLPPVPARPARTSPPVARPLPPELALARFGSLPPGFRITLRDVRPSPDGKGTVEHLLLSDGLTAVSVFSARREGRGHRFQGVSQMGAVNAYGRMVGRTHITVVGEAPPQTVRLIGESLKPEPDATADPHEAAPRP